MNLADLLPKLDFEDPWSVTLGPSLITMSKQSSKSRGPLTFDEWNEAFHIYMAIYIERFPSEAPNMLKYMSIVKDAYEMREHLLSAHMISRFVYSGQEIIFHGKNR